MESPLLKTGEAARYLNVSRGLLYLWRYKGVGPNWIKISSDIKRRACVRYRLEDLEQWLAGNIQQPESAP